jgi:hypothetical protein
MRTPLAWSATLDNQASKNIRETKRVYCKRLSDFDAHGRELQATVLDDAVASLALEML